MRFLVPLATAALLALPSPATAAPRWQCASIDNTANVATWNAGSRLQRATYVDRGGPRLVFSRPVPRAVRLAEARLQLGAPGPKVARACVRVGR